MLKSPKQKQRNSSLVVGLGNPGSEYKTTYHNIGFIIVDAICKYWNFQPFSKKIDHLITFGVINKIRTILLKPYSFMNNSGVPVAKTQNFYKILLSNIIVVHDDADLELGRIKIKKGGSSAGHNGLKSIDSFIGNNYWRIRFGIGRPNDQRDLADHVLSKFENLGDIATLVEKVARNIYLALQGNSSVFISSMMH